MEGRQAIKYLGLGNLSTLAWHIVDIPTFGRGEITLVSRVLHDVDLATTSLSAI